MGDDGNVVIDQTRSDNYVNGNFSDYTAYIAGAKADDVSFIAIPQVDFEKSKLISDLTEGEKDCSDLHIFRTNNLYGWLGFVASALTKTDFKPSATWLIANGPKKITTYRQDGSISGDIFSGACNDGSLDNFRYTIQKHGMVTADCIPNSVDIPTDLSKCKDESALDAKLKQYTQATFTGISVNKLKQALVNVGPVLVSQITPASPPFIQDTILGWDDKNWIYARLDYDQKYYLNTLVISQDDTFTGSVLVDSGSYVFDCTKDITLETPESECPCPSKDDKVALEADPRHVKGGICASGSMRVLLSVVAAAVVIPVIALFF